MAQSPHTNITLTPGVHGWLDAGARLLHNDEVKGVTRDPQPTTGALPLKCVPGEGGLAACTYEQLWVLC